MSDFVKSISTALEAAMKKLQADLRQELKDQGHYLTGRLSNSIEYNIVEGFDKVTATIECEEYGLALEFGVPSGRIPYSPGSGAGTSKYIQGLVTFFQKKGLQGREALGAAFATARAHKREGMPTRGSARFSKSGKRTGFASDVLNRDLAMIAEVMEEKTGAFLQIDFSALEKSEPIVIEV